VWSGIDFQVNFTENQQDRLGKMDRFDAMKTCILLLKAIEREIAK
jgi:hypothetical protein